MGTEVIVLNRSKAKQFSWKEHDRTFAIVSINDFFSDGNKFCHTNPCLKAYKHFFFDDVDVGEPNQNFVLIDEEIARKIATFVRHWYNQVDIIVVHCNAGVSRSAGCAAAILKYFTGSDFQIFDDHSKHPNMLVYRKVLEAFYDTEE